MQVALPPTGAQPGAARPKGVRGEQGRDGTGVVGSVDQIESLGVECRVCESLPSFLALALTRSLSLSMSYALSLS